MRDVPRTTTQRVDPQVRFAPTPGFVLDIAPLGPDHYEDAPADGMQVLLFDQQVDGRGESLVQHRRLVARGTTATAVSTLSQFQVPMDPVLSRLEIHRATLERSGRLIDMTREVSVDFVRDESRLSGGFFTGSVNALVRIPGARADDVIDVSYSLIHRNESLAGRHSVIAQLAFPTVMPNLHFRSLWPQENFRSAVLGPASNLSRRNVDGYVEFSYGPADYTPTKMEDLVPPWRFQQPTLIATRFNSWQEVARWGEAFYRPQITPQVTRIAATIRQEFPDRGDQIAEALRYVQREISYFAILLGEGGYVPLPPDQTLRFLEGDCKAKTLLLLSILEALGISAQAAMVSSNFGPGLLELPPTPALFDHVVVTVSHNGRRYWLDGTLPEQTGQLDAIGQYNLGYALVLDQNASGLTRMNPASSEPRVEVLENIHLISNADHRGEITIEWKFRGMMADQLRMQLEYVGEDETLQQFLRYNNQRFASGLYANDARIVDDQESNTLTMRWSGEARLINFALRGRRPIFAFGAHAPANGILLAPVENRQNAMLLPVDYHVRQETVFTWPESRRTMVTEVHDHLIEADEFTIGTNVVLEGNRAVLTAETHVRGHEFDVGQLNAVKDSLAQLTVLDRLMIVGPEREVIGPRRNRSVNIQQASTLTASTFQPALLPAGFGEP